MSYKEFKKNAEKSGKIKELEVAFWKPNKKGDSILGRVEHVDMIKGSRGTEYGRYTLDTDEGVFMCNFGASIDLLFKNNDPCGRIFEFTYTGKERNSDGNEFHKYQVVEIE